MRVGREIRRGLDREMDVDGPRARGDGVLKLRLGDDVVLLEDPVTENPPRFALAEHIGAGDKHPPRIDGLLLRK